MVLITERKSVNTQPLNKNLSDLNYQPIQYKEGYTEFDSFIQFLWKVLYSCATCNNLGEGMGGGNFTLPPTLVVLP